MKGPWHLYILSSGSRRIGQVKAHDLYEAVSTAVRFYGMPSGVKGAAVEYSEDKSRATFVGKSRVIYNICTVVTR